MQTAAWLMAVLKLSFAIHVHLLSLSHECLSNATADHMQHLLTYWQQPVQVRKPFKIKVSKIPRYVPIT